MPPADPRPGPSDVDAMPVQFATLASGSGGNSAWVQAGGSGLLIDLGLGPRSLAARLAGVGADWDRVAAVVLTHTHGDHVSDASLRLMARQGIDFYCHEGHRPALSRHAGYAELDRAGRVRTYDDRPFLAPNGLRVEPIPLRHDGGPCFGFRVEGSAARRGRWSAVGYATDTGSWTEATADALADVDLLAVEFNHDVEFQRSSGRSPYLIARNLGDRGHLSNDQGAGLVSAILSRSRPGAVRHLALLHLSGQCNRPTLALAAARAALKAAGRRARIHAALQDAPSSYTRVEPARRLATPATQQSFPWEAA